MIRKQTVHIYYRSNFFLRIFNLRLAESANADPTDKKDYYRLQCVSIPFIFLKGKHIEYYLVSSVSLLIICIFSIVILNCTDDRILRYLEYPFSLWLHLNMCLKRHMHKLGWTYLFKVMM
jgi:hypothetical protein